MSKDQDIRDTDPFDKKFPILQKPIEGTTNIEYTAYIFEEIGAPYEFFELLNILNTAIEGDLILLNMSTPGGRGDSAVIIRDAIKNSRADVLGSIVGEVASAGTLIALACDGLRVADNADFMCHNFTAGVYGKGHEIKDGSRFLLKNAKGFIKDCYKDFLTKGELKKLLNGKDYYFNSKELRKRWDNVISKREEAINKVVKEEEEAHTKSLVEHLESKGYSVNKGETKS